VAEDEMTKECTSREFRFRGMLHDFWRPTSTIQCSMGLCGDSCKPII